MKIKKLQPTFKAGDLVRYMGSLMQHSNRHTEGGMGLVLSVREGAWEHLEEDGQTGFWDAVMVYSFSKGHRREYLPDTLTKMEENGEEWYEVGLGDTGEEYYQSPDLSCIERKREDK